MKKKSSFIFNICLIFIVLGLVLYFSLKDNFDEIISLISKMNIFYLLLCIGLLFIYRFLLSVVYYFVTTNNKQKIPFLRIMQINFIIPFFNGVTPFSGGGQPMEIYYLHNEKVPMGTATNIVLQNSIIFQTALLFLGFVSLAYNSIFNLFPTNSLIKKLVIVGFLVNFLVWLATFSVTFFQEISRFIGNVVLKGLSKLKIIKDYNGWQDKLDNYLSKFHESAKALRKNKSLVIKTVLIDIVAIMASYSIPYFLSLGLGASGFNIIEAIVTTCYVMIIGAFVPIPGGRGGIEHGFIVFYGYLLRGSILTALMLIWRFISYYLGITVGALILASYRKKEQKCE